MPHPTGSNGVRVLRCQDQFVGSARQHLAAVAARALVQRSLPLLMAMVIAVAMSQATMPVSSFAASHVNVFSGDIPRATEDVLTAGAYDYRPAGSVRTVAQLTVPAGAHWKTDMSSGSVMLTVASGALRVALDDGAAWIVHPFETDTLHELAPGESIMLFARDRLVMRGGGALLTGNVGQDPVVASVIRVK